MAFEEEPEDELCPTSPFDFVANDEMVFEFGDGDSLRLACATELTPIDGLLLAGYEEGGAVGDATDDLTGARVWPGCELLLRFIAAHPALTRGRVCVELGAGTGACGLAAARTAGGGACAACVLTDGSEECVRLCERNIAANAGLLACSDCSGGGGGVAAPAPAPAAAAAAAAAAPVSAGVVCSAEYLRWGFEDGAGLRARLGQPFDLVLAAEVFYDGEQVPLLFAAARGLLGARQQQQQQQQRAGEAAAARAAGGEGAGGGEGDGASVAEVCCGQPLLVLSQIPRCDYSTISADIAAAAAAAGFVEVQRIEGAEALAPYALDRENAHDSAERGAHIVVFRLLLEESAESARRPHALCAGRFLPE